MDDDLLAYILHHGACPRRTRIRSKSAGCPDDCKPATPLPKTEQE